jgi:hypothetical protein
VVSGGVLDDVMIGQLDIVASFIDLRGAVPHGYGFALRGILAVVLRTACLGWHFIGVLGWFGHI